MKRVYIAYFDGYLDGYGTTVSLLGVYDTKEQAEAAFQTLPDEIKDSECRCRVSWADMNETLKVKKSQFYTREYFTNVCLASYAE